VSDPALFLGRFHPLIVHFPIALLLLALLVEWIASRRPTSGAASLAGLILWLGSMSAVLSAMAGLLLGSSGTYAGQVYDRHMFLGLAVAAASTVSALMWSLRDRGARWVRAQQALLVLTVFLVVPAGHLGATLTHGEGFLSEYAPTPLRSLLGTGEAAARRPEGPVVVYDALVAPALQSRCVTCHGPAKVEGGLRLDTAAALLKGGDDGPIVTPGRADVSDIVRRIWLPQSHEDAMPPKGHRPLTPSEASLLRWWIEQGARADLTLADADITPDVAPIVEAMIGPLERGGPSMPSDPVAAASKEAIAAVTASGLSVEPVGGETTFLHVHATNGPSRIGDDAVGTLSRIAPQVVWLDLGGTKVTDAGLAHVALLKNLTRLHLQRTAVGNAGLAQLAGLTRLEYLNVYGTRVSDEGLKALAGVKTLRSLYVWQTAVTPEGVASLKAALPRLAIEAGEEPRSK
jgi:uncharacterized membrane protein/mono/diheme cytochrome c family protein